jgi:hypothetical protein
MEEDKRTKEALKSMENDRWRIAIANEITEKFNELSRDLQNEGLSVQKTVLRPENRSHSRRYLYRLSCDNIVVFDVIQDEKNAFIDEYFTFYPSCSHTPNDWITCIRKELKAAKYKQYIFTVNTFTFMFIQTNITTYKVYVGWFNKTRFFGYVDCYMPTMDNAQSAYVDIITRRHDLFD